MQDHAGGSRGLGIVINIQLQMTGQDKPRVSRGYQEKPPCLDIFYQFLLSVIRTQQGGGGRILNQNKLMRLYLATYM